MPNSERNSTAHEIEWLDGVVTGKWGDCDVKLVLTNYLKHAYTRKWNRDIEVDVLVDHACKLLNGMTK